MLPEHAFAQMRDKSSGNDLDTGVTAFFRAAGSAYEATTNLASNFTNGDWEVKLTTAERQAGTQGIVQFRHTSGLTQMVPLTDVDDYKAVVAGMALEATSQAIKTKTDGLNFTAGNVNADVKVNMDKAEYVLKDGTITAATFAVDAISASAFSQAAADKAKADVSNLDVAVSTRSSHSAADVATALGTRVVEGTVTYDQSLRLANSANGAKLSGASTTNVNIRDLGDTKNRVAAVVDADGNRESVTLNLT